MKDINRELMEYLNDVVKILEFGSNWWARFGRDPQDRYRYTRHAAYFNSTACAAEAR